MESGTVAVVQSPSCVLLFATPWTATHRVVYLNTKRYFMKAPCRKDNQNIRALESAPPCGIPRDASHGTPLLAKTYCPAQESAVSRQLPADPSFRVCLSSEARLVSLKVMLLLE